MTSCRSEASVTPNDPRTYSASTYARLSARVSAASSACRRTPARCTTCRVTTKTSTEAVNAMIRILGRRWNNAVAPVGRKGRIVTQPRLLAAGSDPTSLASPSDPHVDRQAANQQDKAGINDLGARPADGIHRVGERQGSGADRPSGHARRPRLAGGHEPRQRAERIRNERAERREQDDEGKELDQGP